MARLPDVLAPDGLALLEIGADQKDAVVDLARELLPGWSCRVETDLAGLPRVARLERPEVPPLPAPGGEPRSPFRFGR
ncbi:MAG: hypothetical protein KatS3mg065_0830 [Chloroflexota bacterium]|nr:MAG: hypothetical protein KatS3mg065_0830 [Chloroflexota bacterium]